LSRHAAEAFGPAALHFSTAAEMNAALSTAAVSGPPPEFASALVKGSRFMKMEQVVAALQAHPALLVEEAQACS
jgi:UDP-N-acetylmuramoyl-tripeptide--D-alanyl-D-alanine ligase